MRSVSSAALRLMLLRPIGRPNAMSLSATVEQAFASGSAHSTRTGSRLPSLPWRNGSGYEPTTARTSGVTPHSWWSHQMRSPPLTSIAPAPSSVRIPLT